MTRAVSTASPPPLPSPRDRELEAPFGGVRIDRHDAPADRVCARRQRPQSDPKLGRRSRRYLRIANIDARWPASLVIVTLLNAGSSCCVNGSIRTAGAAATVPPTSGL